jgi:carboxymethylenebutenolidase
MPDRRLELRTPDGVANAYFTRPDGPDPAPGVLLYSDAFGLRPALERLADRIASAGYAVLVPNVYYRNGADPLGELPQPIDLAGRPDLRDRIRPLMQSLDSAGNQRDAAAYLGFLAESPDVADGPVGVTGYCMGVRLALRSAQASPHRVAAVAGFHGGSLATDDPESPHRGVGALQAEVYLAHADHDAGMPPEQIERLNAALDEAGVRYRAEVYPDAPHGFAMADTTAYRQDAAERHFTELVGLLDRTLPRP